MGWVWKDDDEGTRSDQCSTRKIVTSQCKTQEVEPGKFVRKCEKTEQLLKDCVGRPTEVVQSNKEYTEEDVTDQMLNGSFSMGSSELGPFDRPGLRSGLDSDIEAIERSIFDSMNRFFDVAEEVKNGFFNVFGTPRLYDRDSPSSSWTRRGIPIEGHPPKETSPKYRDSPSSSWTRRGIPIEGHPPKETSPKYRDSPSSSSTRRGIPIEGHPPKETSPKSSNREGHVDLSGLAREV